MAKYLMKFPFAIDHIQIIKMPKGAEVLDIEVVNDDLLKKNNENLQIYLIAKVEQDATKYQSVIKHIKNLEPRKFVTYGIGSLMEETGEKLKLIGRYSLTFRRFEDFPLTKSFYVFEKGK